MKTARTPFSRFCFAFSNYFVMRSKMTASYAGKLPDGTRDALQTLYMRVAASAGWLIIDGFDESSTLMNFYLAEFSFGNRFFSFERSNYWWGTEYWRYIELLKLISVWLCYFKPFFILDIPLPVIYIADKVDWRRGWETWESGDWREDTSTFLTRAPTPSQMRPHGEHDSIKSVLEKILLSHKIMYADYVRAE